MTSKKKIRRRSFSAEFKKRVVAEACQSDCSWSEVARRYELNANLLFKWKEKFESEITFLPVEVKVPTTEVAAINDDNCLEPEARKAGTTSISPLEILFPCGTQLRCGKDTDPNVLSHALNILRPQT